MAAAQLPLDQGSPTHLGQGPIPGYGPLGTGPRKRWAQACKATFEQVRLVKPIPSPSPHRHHHCCRSAKPERLGITTLDPQSVGHVSPTRASIVTGTHGPTCVSVVVGTRGPICVSLNAGARGVTHVNLDAGLRPHSREHCPEHCGYSHTRTSTLTCTYPS